LTPDDIKTLIEQSLDADKADDITTINLAGQSALADYIIIASGTSSRHVAGMAEKLKDRLNTRGIKRVKMEGRAQSDWVAIDAGDVIVHLFRPEVRAMQREEHQKLFAAVQDNAFLIALDERGKTLSSPEFSDKIEQCRLNNVPLLQIMIGGANGLSEEIRSRANLTLSFGKQTWPHMMVRVMIMEQLYRAQQIHAGHPYHKA